MRFNHSVVGILSCLIIFFPLSAYCQSYYDNTPDYYPPDDTVYQRSNDNYYSENDPSYDNQYDNYYQEPRAYHSSRHNGYRHADYSGGSYYSRLPSHIATSEKVIVVDPNVHAWGAYSADGQLIKAGLASAGSSWCRDLGRPCHTSRGSFRIISLGSASCISRKFPLGEGGAPMPYCMYFNRTQALHGSNELAEGNISHGCVRMHVSDAAWIRFNFAHIGTKVIVKPY